MVARPARPLALTSVPALIVVDALRASYTRVLEAWVAPAAAEQERIEVDAPAVEYAVDDANLRVCPVTDVDRSRICLHMTDPGCSHMTDPGCLHMTDPGCERQRNQQINKHNSSQKSSLRRSLSLTLTPT